MQNICPEEEWNHFITVLKSDLPTSFRITASFDSEAKSLLKLVEGVFFTDLLKGEESDELQNSKPFCLPWFVYLLVIIIKWHKIVLMKNCLLKIFITVRTYFICIIFYYNLGTHNDWDGN